MFSKLMAFIFGKKVDNANGDIVEAQPVSSPGSVEIEPEAEQAYGYQSLEHARELSLAFISNLLGVRAIATEESKAQESILRDALDEELVGLSEKSIPKLSRNALTLMNDLMDPEVPKSRIVSAIKEDPALAGKVISIANSPLFVASDVEIKDLEHALSMLGDIRLKDVVMSSLVADKFEVNSYYFDTFGKALWDHSTEVAINARNLAEASGANPSLAFFIGLVHDIGKLIIFKKLVELHTKDSVEPHPLVFSHLLNDYSHALTRQACEVWGLPDNWYEPIVEFQMAEPGDLKLPESIALFLGNSFAELHALYTAREITEFELVWRLGELGSGIEEFNRLYPDMLKENVK